MSSIWGRSNTNLDGGSHTCRVTEVNSPRTKTVQVQMSPTHTHVCNSISVRTFNRCFTLLGPPKMSSPCQWNAFKMPEFKWQQQSEECKQMNSNEDHIFRQHQILHRWKQQCPCIRSCQQWPQTSTRQKIGLANTYYTHTGLAVTVVERKRQLKMRSAHENSCRQKFITGQIQEIHGL